MTEIKNTFVQVAQDCPVTVGVIPPTKPDAKPSIHAIQYELLSASPYFFTLEDLIYEVYIRHKDIPREQVELQGATIRAALFQKSHPCMRASMLPKKFGWGVHYDHEGRLALYGMETEEYRKLASGAGDGPQLVFAMRNKKAK
ncbi:DUF6157 family protein [Brevibacillus choshinensis]|uniref:Uncharacterized protein n=1 Tax=Brevibacillus choshinensis TaxID=54911 RepID=A0ABX7FME6_BRECH|nr:DUF6157 family protein [Brevibacillus choshinensis]QRG66830.1 hypothetical protein JNE38_25665 [Brevibacillus choshinensis]